MSESPLRIAVADPALAARLRGLPGIEVVPPGAPADAVLTPAPPAAGPALTAREQEVLSLLAEGASNKAIARALGISPHTAKFHVGQVIGKLDAASRTDAVTHAARRGVLSL